jgi:hypothetical protein
MANYRESFDLSRIEFAALVMGALLFFCIAWMLFVPFYAIALFIIDFGAMCLVWQFRGGECEVSDTEIMVRSSMMGELRLKKTEVDKVVLAKKILRKGEAAMLEYEDGQRVPAPKTWYPFALKTFYLSQGVLVTRKDAPLPYFVVSRAPMDLKRAIDAMMASPW